MKIKSFVGLGIICLFFSACSVSQKIAGETAQARQVAENAGWSDNVTLTFEDDQMIVWSNGLPKHEILRAYQALSIIDNKTVYLIEPQEQRMRVGIPLRPKLAKEKTPKRIGLIGIAISGALFYSPYEADGTTIALDGNFIRNGIPFIDDCTGHPNPFAVQYHYHGIPYCLTKTVDRPGEHSRLLGYILDGFPVYGPQDAGGKIITPTDLDQCNGHFSATLEFPEGIYHYHLTKTAPYSITCYSGEINISASPLALLTRGIDLTQYWRQYIFVLGLSITLIIVVMRNIKK